MAVLLLTFLGVALLAYLLVSLFYWAFQERFIFVRFRVGPGYRFRFRHGVPFTEHRLHRPDGAVLHALLFKAEEPRGVVLYFHGNTGSLRRWGRRAPRFTKLGYHVLMPDYRGYGKSRGRISEEALLADAMAWYDHLCAQWQEREIVVYGRSLGSGMAVPVAAVRKPRALLLETPFANLRDAVRHHLPWLPHRWLLRYHFRNDRAIRRVRCPVRIFHGLRDTVVPFSSALFLYSLIDTTVDREMLTFQDGHHNDLARFGRFNRAIAKVLAAPVSPSA